MTCCPNAKRLFFVLAIASLAGGGFLLNNSEMSVAQDEKETKLLRHVVMFKFKDTSSESDIQGVVDAFRALPSKIPQIRDFEYGTNNSPESHDGGLTHCFLLTFHSEKDREIYLPHPDHKAFGAVLGPHLDKVTVVDYWAEK